MAETPFSSVHPSNMAAPSDFSSRSLEACEAGEAFIKEFYTTVDKRRNLLSGFYSDSSFMVWNGHPHTGAMDISNFYQGLPSSEHEITSFDCQPVMDGQGQTQVLVVCTGQVLFETSNGDNTTNQFNQNFILVKQGEFWKINNDSFRFQDI